jgi:translation elongation factor EF-G
MEKEIGKITHIFEKIDVGILELSGNLKVGDTIHVVGSQSDFEQLVDSMQVDRQNIIDAKKGSIVGLKLISKAKVGDKIYLKN